jgi:hypothetical protein
MRQELAWSVWVHVPLPLQRSFVHETPSLVHDVDDDAFVKLDVLTADWHVWQELAGLAVLSE